MSRSIAIFDLDHGLLAASPGRLLAEALRSEDGAPATIVEVAELLHALADASPGPLGGELTLRALAQGLRGTSVKVLGRAGAAAADRARDLVRPHARPLLRQHREAGQRLVLTTHLPRRAAEPIRESLGFDALVATDTPAADGVLTGAVDPPLAWGRGKLLRLRAWAEQNGASLRRSTAYAGSVHDAPLLAEVRNPTVVDPDPTLAALAWLKGWPTRSLFVPAGVPRFAGREIQEWLRPFARPELVPYARFELHDLEHVPTEGPAILCANHRSYFDVTAVGLVLGRRGRAARFLGKKEVFDVPVFGAASRWIGGIRVERGTGSDEPLRAAAQALEGGELIAIMPQGTIPRGPAFFDPELKGRWGAARLAGMTGAPVIPLGLWGTEKVWPRAHRLPRPDLLHPPTVTVRAGPPVPISGEDPDTDTKAIMAAISDLLPAEAHVRREPTPEELALTYPPGYQGDPSEEPARRPGTDI